MKIRFPFSRTIGLLAGCLFAVLLSVGYCEARTPGGKDDKEDKTLETLRKISEELNRKCPVAFDATTSLKSTLVLPPRTLRCMVTVPDSTRVETLRTDVVPLMRTMVKDTPVMKPLRDAGTCFSFWFETPGDNHIFDFEVTPEDYREKAKEKR